MLLEVMNFKTEVLDKIVKALCTTNVECMGVLQPLHIHCEGKGTICHPKAASYRRLLFQVGLQGKRLDKITISLLNEGLKYGGVQRGALVMRGTCDEGHL